MKIAVQGNENPPMEASVEMVSLSRLESLPDGIIVITANKFKEDLGQFYAPEEGLQNLARGFKTASSQPQILERSTSGCIHLSH